MNVSQLIEQLKEIEQDGNGDLRVVNDMDATLADVRVDRDIPDDVVVLLGFI